MASLAKRLNFGSGEIRVAVLLYSDYVRPAIRFDVAKNPEFLKLVLDGLPFLSARGGRRFDRALVGAAQTLGGSTDNVRKIVVLLAAGQQTQEFAVDDAVNRLKADKAEMYVVAIEPRASREELRPIVERDEDVISVNTFDGLMTQLAKIAEHISKGLFCFIVLQQKNPNDMEQLLITICLPMDTSLKQAFLSALTLVLAFFPTTVTSPRLALGTEPKNCPSYDENDLILHLNIPTT